MLIQLRKLAVDWRTRAAELRMRGGSRVVMTRNSVESQVWFAAANDLAQALDKVERDRGASGSSAGQAASVAAGKAFDAVLPEPMSLEAWRARLAPWAGRNRMGLYDVTVGELLQLVERCERAESAAHDRP